MVASAFKFVLAHTLAVMGLANAEPQAVTDAPMPANGPMPSGCVSSFPSRFEITTVDVDEPALVRRASACHGPGTLLVSIKDGVMTDDKGWTAYIASNFQFQFDNPPQAGALTTSGFSVCPETGYVAIGGSTRFYRCVSGTFSNIYDRHWAPQCREIRMLALPCGEGAGEVGSGSTNVVGTTMVATTIVTVLADGQLQVVTTVVPVAMCQIGDGQVQAHTTPCAELVPSTTYAPVSELEDGQVPAPSGTLPVPSGVVPPPPPAASTTKPPVAPAPSADTSSTLPPTTPPASTTTLTVSADASGLAATASRASFFALTAGVLSLFAWL